MIWKVMFNDIDPDAGTVSKVVEIASCDTEELANWVKYAIEKDWYSVDGSNDPNREFYVKPTEECDLLKNLN